ncbi:MAG: flippase-like domain-containing protein [Dehalococcoidia bacterium]|nr:flippase-like domain-containing protein [Dehalococcoidia bacterium]
MSLKLKPWQQLALGLAISLIFVYLLYREIDLEAWRQSLRDADYRYLAPVLAVMVFGWYLRGLRWRILLSPLITISPWRCFSIVSVAALINVLVPARAGEVWRAHRLGRDLGLSRSTAFGTIIVERLLDGLVVAFLGLIVLLTVTTSGVIAVLVGLSALGFATAALALGVLAHSSRLRRRLAAVSIRLLPRRHRAFVEEKLSLLLVGLQTVRSRSSLALAAAVTVMINVFDAVAFYLVGEAFGFDVALHNYLLIVVVANLATAVPVSIAGVGPVEFFVVRGLRLMGVGSSAAAAYAAVVHGLITVVILTLGVAFAWRMGLNVRSIFKRPAAEAGTPESAGATGQT